MPGQNKKNNAELVHSHKKFENITYQEKWVAGREFNDCVFLKCNLYGANFEGSVFHDCVFEGCDLSLLKVKHCTFVNIHISNSKAMGILWYEATNMFSLKFTDSCLDFSSFYGKAVKKTTFAGCQMREVDFTRCNLAESDFEGADLLGAAFHESDLTKANFVNARNYLINMHTNVARQAKFSMPEAMALFRNFDIIVEM